MKKMLAHVTACFLASTSVCSANTGPLLDLGTVSTFNTARLDKSANLAVPYTGFTQQVSFSLSSAATVRIDMREIGFGHWLTPQYTSNLGVDSFSLLNNDQKLIGTATLDPAFSGTKASCYTGGKCSGEFGTGYTFTTQLEAGTYSMDLKGHWIGANMPELNFGVLVMGAGDQAAYFGALTTKTDLPEPSSYLLMALGLCAMAIGTRTRRAG